MNRAHVLALAAAVALGGVACDASKARPVEPTAEVDDCTRCHAYPPATVASGAAHPASTECAACHPGTVAATPDNRTIIPGGDHMNGVVDAVGAGHALPFGVAAHKDAALANIGSCTACHGADYGGGVAESCTACHVASGLAGAATWTTNCTFCHGTRTAGVSTATPAAAPPQAVDGSATGQKVGAHQAHLTAGAVANAMACGDCHTVPGSAQALTHFAGYDGSPADVTFANSAFATKGAGTPAYAGATCAVYCHGAGTEFGSPAGQASPAWTDTTALGCTSCHEDPPTRGPQISGQAPHAFHGTAGATCATCHGAGYSGSSVNKATHVNGTKDVVANAGWDCSQCHTALGIQGAHSLPFEAGHTSVALASIASCTACHGADYNGGSAQSCTACHVARGLVGASTWPANCTFCHGTRTAGVATATPAAAPPEAVDGSATGQKVGAHQAHLVQGTIAQAMACASCHAVPAGGDLTHFAGYDGTAADVTFANSAFATKGVTGASYTGGTCNVYCHGSGTEFSTAKISPQWTSTGVGCTSCHNYPPAAPHTSSTSCSTCHPDTVEADNVTIKVAGGFHVNGVKDSTSPHAANWGLKTEHGYWVNLNGLANPTLNCKSCHGATLAGGSGRACSSCHDATVPNWGTACTFCHGTRTAGITTPDPKAAPPVDIQGRSAATNVSVGLHQAHVLTSISTPLACTECHPTRTTSVIDDAAHIDGNGLAEVSFGALARTGGAAANYNRTSATQATCSSVYCHGAFTNGANATPSWTSGTLSCTMCHGNPPNSGQHWHNGRNAGGSVINCSDCHTAGAGATHVNGTKNVPLSGASSGTPIWNPANRTCGSFSCHGKSHNTGDTW